MEVPREGDSKTTYNVGVISGGTSVKMPSLTKDGTGVLTVYGGIAVTNMLSVCTGKVELVGLTTNAQNAAGLYMYSTNFGSKTDLSNYFKGSIGVTFAKGLSAGNLRKVFDHVMDIRRDSPSAVNGVDMAFGKWSSAQKLSMYAYTGYFRNLAETNVTVTFGLSIWDVEALWIDGVNLLANVGTRYTTPNEKTYCLQLNDVRLTQGPHKIEVLLGHFTSSNGGANSSQYPEEDDAIDWPAGHGFVLRYGANDNNRSYADGGYIDIKNSIVTLPGKFAKNRRRQEVTVPKKVLKLMIDLDIFKSPSQYYVFGPDLSPSMEQVAVNRFRQEWAKMRRVFGWPDTYQFYSLKDSGISDNIDRFGLLTARDQARHSDAATTNRYAKIKRTAHVELRDWDGDL